MSTETQTGENGAVATGAQTLTVTDNRTGQTYELPITDGTIRGAGPAPDQDRRRGLRPDVLRPGVHEHRVVPVGDHVHRRRQGHPRVPRLPDRAARREARPTSRSPTCSSTASCPRSRSSTSGRSEITTHTFVHENVKGFMQGFRHDAHPMGMLLGSVGALSTFYPDAKDINDADEPPHPDDPADREDADARRVLLPAHARPAVRLPGQRPVATPGNFLGDAEQDDRAQVRARSAARARARHPLHPARRPRAELLDERRAHGRLLAASTRTPRSPPASPRSTARSHGGANEAVLKMLQAHRHRGARCRRSSRA